MSDRITNKRLLVLLKHGVAGFALVFALGIFLSPQSAFALDEPVNETPPTEAPLVLPATCTALPGAITPPPTEPETNPETNPEVEPETPAPTPENPAPAVPAWSALNLSTTQFTNSMNLTWNWETPVSTNPDVTYRGFGFALYAGDTLLANGELGPDAKSYAYAVPANGVYRLFVWVLDTTEDPATPEATGCEYADATFDTTPPVVSVDGDGFVSNGNTATTTLSTTETDLTYIWSVTSNGGTATISDINSLNPTVTFFADGTYTFTLTATDSLGNTVVITLVITYEEPFVPGPETPLPPGVPAPVDPYVPPEVIIAESQQKVAVGASYRAAASTDSISNDSDDEDSPLAVANETADDLSAVAAASTAQPIQSSNQGWLILGVPWYWWLLGLAIIISAIQWYRSGAFRKTPDDM